jgi:NAD(P)H-dependent flavin oxidoreductase YrpB (nitropropane dioxygenase family)
MVMLRQQKKDYYLRQLCTRACIRVALLHRHVRISARLCVEGQGRAKKGMFEGDLVEGELEIGQVSSTINKILSAEQIINEIIEEYQKQLNAQVTSKYIFE